MRDLPAVFNDAPKAHYLHDRPGEKAATHQGVVDGLIVAGHLRCAAEWAVHEHARAGRLHAEKGFQSLPVMFFNGQQVSPGPGYYLSDSLGLCCLRATPALWKWWHDLASGNLSHHLVTGVAGPILNTTAITLEPDGHATASGHSPGKPPGCPKKKPNTGKPSRDRQDDILAAIANAGVPLTRPEIVKALKLKEEGKLGHHLAWMVKNDILTNIPSRGYWPPGRPVPN